MSQPFDGSTPPPAKSGGGMSTVMIVLIVLGLLGLLCCGGCVGACIMGGRAVGGAGLMGVVLPQIQRHPTVTEKFGGTVQPLGFPTQSNVSFQEGANSTADFDISGPNGKGTVHVEATTGGPQGFTPTVIKVTAPDGTVIDVLAPTSDTEPDMPDDMGMEDADGTDADSTDM